MRNKKYFEIRLRLNQSLCFKTYKTYITTILMHSFFKLYKNKNLQCSFQVTADVADKVKLYIICSVLDTSKKNFCYGLEMKFASPLTL